MRAAFVIAVALVIWGAPSVQKKTKSSPPIIRSFTSSADTIIYCPAPAPSRYCENGDRRLRLTTTVEDSEKGALTYTYFVAAGRIEGKGRAVIWDLTGAIDGEHTATVRVKSANGSLSIATLKVTIAACCNYDPPREFHCPEITVSCPSEIEKGKPIRFTANVKDDTLSGDVSYEWWTSSGKIVKGQFEKIMTWEPSRFPFETVTATVSVRGFDPSCPTQASCTVSIK